MSSIAKHVITRLALGASVPLLLAGCGSGPTSVLSAPSAPSTACTPPSFPGMFGGPSSIPCGPYVVSGVVTEAASPIAGVNVSAFVETSGFGYSYMWAHGALLTDGAGHYLMSALPAGAHLWFHVWKDGYVQQCAAPSVTIQVDMTMDLTLVSKVNLTASTTESAPAGLRWVSGTIVEITPTGKQPVAGVFVDFEPLEDFPAAVTYSDAAGRFALCGLPQNDTVKVGAGLGNRVTYANVPPGQTTGIEITLP
jgi:hypothetical protein